MITIDKTIPNLPTVSASKIKVYKTCAFQYYLKYRLPFNDRPADDKNVASLLGTALHEAIELYYGKGISATQTFQTVMDETITKWEDDKVKINAAGYYTTAMKIGKEILNNFNWKQFNPIELEYSFTLPFPNPIAPILNMTGYIDLIDRSRKLIVDFKSASHAPAQDELDHDPQFIIYAWAYEQIYNEKPDSIIWYHLRTDKQYEAHVQHNYQDKINKLSEDMLAMLESQRFARRQMDSVCKTKCSFYELCYGTKSEGGLLLQD